MHLAYCGFNCETCPVYMATIQKDKALQETLAKEYSTKNSLFVAADMICKGCKAKVVSEKMCGFCEMRRCGIEKKVDNCGMCAEYPCTKIETYIPRAKTREVLDAIRQKQFGKEILE